MQFPLKMLLVLTLAMGCHLAMTAPANAQSESDSDTLQYWEKGGNLDLNFSQVALQNWVGGGSSSIALNGSVNLFLNYEKDVVSWRNNIDVSYGLVNTEEQETFRKSDDNLNITSNYSRELSEHWRFSGLLDFKTMMTEGYRYSQDSLGEEQRTLISDFMAPGYVITSAGFTYEPTEGFRFLGSPLTGKTTFLLHDELSEAGGFGVEPGEHFRQEIGSNVNILIETRLMKNVNFKTEANFFSAYKNPTEIDVNWRAQLGLRINEYLSATINTHLIYDEDTEITREDGTTGPAVQFKEVIAVGFSCEL